MSDGEGGAAAPGDAGSPAGAAGGAVGGGASGGDGKRGGTGADQRAGAAASADPRARDGADEGTAALPRADPYRAAAVGSTKLGGADVGEAYRKGRHVFRTDGHGALFAGGKVSNVHLGDVHYGYSGGHPRRLKPGPVWPEDLSLIRDRYAKVPYYDRLLGLLRERNLVLLRGVSGTGRTMTAMHLLDATSGGWVFRLDTSQSVHLLDGDDVDPGSGQFAELRLVDAVLLSQMHLDRLSALLAERPGWMVLVVPHDFRPQPDIAAYLVDCGEADRAVVLDRHLAWSLRDADDAAVAEMRALAASPAITEALGPAPTPAEVMAMVGLLAEHRLRRLTHEEVVRRCARLTEQVVVDWFDQVRDERGEHADATNRLAGFRIALAVLNQSPYHQVAQAGEQLGNQLIRSRHPHREPGVPVFAAEHDGWLTGSRASLVPGTMRINGATVPCELAAFIDDRMPLAVLSYVWQRHHNVREPVARWLRALAGDPRPHVWMRAAQAVGLLCALDFPYGLHEMIMPWATAEGRPDDQVIASYALDQSARDPRIEPVVRALVDDWKESEQSSLRRAATAVLGHEFGLARVEQSLADLLALGTWRDDEEGGAPLLLDAAASVASLLALGAVEPVTDRLRAWFRADRRAVADVALVGTLFTAGIKVRDLLDIELITADGGRDRWPHLAGRMKWPLLLALADDDGQLLEPFVDLFWSALDTARSQAAALDVLAEWIIVAQQDRTCLPVLARFLRLLGDSRNSRQRLHYLIRTMRQRWEKPLSADVADYLDLAVADPADGLPGKADQVRIGVS
jgi:hypothetical protein